jgi:hypothetical protein
LSFGISCIVSGTIFLATAWCLENMVVDPANRAILKIQSHIDYIVNSTASVRMADIEVHGAYQTANSIVPEQYKRELVSAQYNLAASLLEGNYHIAALKTDSLEIAYDDDTSFARLIHNADSFMLTLDTTALSNLNRYEDNWAILNSRQIRDDALARKRELSEKINHSHILILFFVIMGVIMVNYDKVTEFIHSKGKNEETKYKVDKKGKQAPT